MKPDSRSLAVLKSLIKLYINDGQPVGSKMLAQSGDIGLSSASIRHILADLESHGLLTSPHPSSGRIPTARAYRLFVNELLTQEELNSSHGEIFYKALHPDMAVGELVDSASNIVSQLTKLAGIVTLPKFEGSILRHIEFLSLSDARVLVILVLNTREVQNRIIHLDREHTETELQEIANYINQRFMGVELSTVRHHLMSALKEDRANINQMLQNALDLADKAFRIEPLEDDYVIAGENHLFDVIDLEQLQSLFNAFTEKQGILHILDKCLRAEEVQIFIGEESGYKLLNHCSLVMAPYKKSETVLGVIGVIGPTRMAYSQVIQTVKKTASFLGKILGEVT